MKEVILNADELNDLLEYWQKELRLENWDIVVNLYRQEEFYDEESQGENSYDIRTGQSIIRILDHIDWPIQGQRFPQDMERCLVHELLHLHFEPFEPKDKKSLEHDLMERTIETLAGTLVALRRKGKE